MGKQWKQCQTLFFLASESLQMVIAAMKLKDAYSLEGGYDQISGCLGWQRAEKRDYKSKTYKCIKPTLAHPRFVVQTWQCYMPIIFRERKKKRTGACPCSEKDSGRSLMKTLNSSIPITTCHLHEGLQNWGWSTCMLSELWWWFHVCIHICQNIEFIL